MCLCYVLFLCRAFVTPADIQTFTSESKNKLSARLQGKTVQKHFVQAVKEICAAFDENQKLKASGLADDTDDSRLGSEAPSVDGVVGNLKDAADAVVSNAEKDDICMDNVDPNLEHCTQRIEESGNQDEKLSESGHPNDSSGSLPVIKSKLPNGSEIMNKSSKSSVKGASSVDDNGHGVLKNGSKTRKVVTGSKKQSEAADDINKNGGSSTGKNLKEGNSTGGADRSRSGVTLKDGKKRKIAPSVKSDAPETLKSGSNGNAGEKSKNLIPIKTSPKVKKDLQESEETDGKSSSMGKKVQLLAKHNVRANESLHATKRLKRADAKDDSTLGYLPKDVKSAPPGSIAVEGKAFKKMELKRSTSNLKTEKSVPSRAQVGVVGSDDSVHEVLPETNHHSKVQQAMPDSDCIASDEKKDQSALRLKGDKNNVKQVQKKRRVVCVYDDEDDDEPKTPVHGGPAKTMKSPIVSEVKKSNDAQLERSDDTQLAPRKSSEPENIRLKEPSSQLRNDSSSIKQPKKDKGDEVIPVHAPCGHDKLDPKQTVSKMAKLSSASPVKSPQSLPAMKPNLDRNKSSKPLLKGSSNATQKKVDHASSKSSHNLSSSQNQVATHKKKLASSSETSKTTPKTLPQAVEVPPSTLGFKEPDALHVDRYICFGLFLFPLELFTDPFPCLICLCYNRLEVSMEEKSIMYAGSGTPESARTMRHLIAVAQAKRKQAHSQYLTLGIHNFQGGTPSPSSVQPILSISNSFVQTDVQGVYEHTALASPPTNEHHSASRNLLDADEIEERRVGSAQRGVGGSLSGGTEAAVARDAFEGMIETLSRTKESIGRATRLAIDCAKYGIANEVSSIILLLVML